MIRRFIFVAALFALVTLQTLAQTAQKAQRLPLTSRSTLAINGIGPIGVGMTVAEALKSLGRKITLGQRISDGDCRYAEPASGPKGVAFMVIDGVIARIDVDSKRIKTRKGIGIGDTEAQVMAAYPGQIKVTTHTYDDKGHYLTFVPKDRKDRNFRLVFETDGKRVTSFRAGRLPEVEWVEGCL